MIRRLIPSFLACLLATACSPADEDAASVKVHNGQVVRDPNDPVYQSTVVLLRGERDFCTGTLVAVDTVVSAAHCFAENDALGTTGLNVGFGTGPMHAYVATLSVREVRYHRDFGLWNLVRELSAQWDGANPALADERRAFNTRVAAGERLTAQEKARVHELDAMFYATAMPTLNDPPRAPNDIAIMRIEGALPAFARPVAIAADGEVAVGQDVIAAGYGLTAEDDSGVSSRLKQTTLRIEALNAGVKEVRTKADDGHDTCKGDSGGPLYVRAGNALHLVGATSRAMAFGPCGSVGSVATDVRGHRAWVGCQYAALHGQAPAGCDAAGTAVVVQFPPRT